MTPPMSLGQQQLTLRTLKVIRCIYFFLRCQYMHMAHISKDSRVKIRPALPPPGGNHSYQLGIYHNIIFLIDSRLGDF